VLEFSPLMLRGSTGAGGANHFSSKRVSVSIALVLMLVLAAELSLSVRWQSETFDESVHLFAGYRYWKHRDFGANPEHPPLVKLVAALPLLALNLRELPVLPEIRNGPTSKAPLSFFIGTLWMRTPYCFVLAWPRRCLHNYWRYWFLFADLKCSARSRQ